MSEFKAETRVVPDWDADEEAAEAFATEREDEGFDIRIVRRYVTTEEEIS